MKFFPLRTELKADPTRHPGIAASIVAVVLGALAGGVLWCFASVATPFDTDWLIVPIGMALGLFLRWQGLHGRRAAICAVYATLLAFAYAEYLFGAVRIADSMGLPLREALFKVGFSLTADIAWANLRMADWIALALALLASVGAALVGARDQGMQRTD